MATFVYFMLTGSVKVIVKIWAQFILVFKRNQMGPAWLRHRLNKASRGLEIYFQSFVFVWFTKLQVGKINKNVLIIAYSFYIVLHKNTL